MNTKRNEKLYKLINDYESNELLIKQLSANNAKIKKVLIDKTNEKGIVEIDGDSTICSLKCRDKIVNITTIKSLKFSKTKLPPEIKENKLYFEHKDSFSIKLIPPTMRENIAYHVETITESFDIETVDPTLDLDIDEQLVEEFHYYY